MSPTDLVELIQKRYDQCSTYSDSGQATFVDFQAETSFRFKTYFLRPNFYKFEWNENGDQFMIWCDGKHSFQRFASYNYADIILEKDIGAIAEAFGMTRGASWNILSMLMNFQDLGEPLISPDQGLAITRSENTICVSSQERDKALVNLKLSAADYRIVEIAHIRRISIMEATSMFKRATETLEQQRKLGKISQTDYLRLVEDSRRTRLPTKDFNRSQVFQFHKTDFDCALDISQTFLKPKFELH